MLYFFRPSDLDIACNFFTTMDMENEKRGSNEKVEKTTQKLLTEQDPYNIITQCDVVRNA